MSAPHFSQYIVSAGEHDDAHSDADYGAGADLPGSIRTPTKAAAAAAKKGILVSKHKTGLVDSVAAVQDKPAKVPPKAYTIHMPSLTTSNWEDVVHSVVWRVGRHFGFQAFNMNPKTRDFVSCMAGGRAPCMGAEMLPWCMHTSL